MSATRGKHAGAGEAGRGRRRRKGDAGRSRPPKQVQVGFLSWRLPSAGGPIVVLREAPAGPEDKEREEDYRKVRADLAAAKSRLDSIPPEDFDSLMRACDLYSGLKRTLRKEYGFPLATNATLKMYELITQMGLLPCGQRIRAFCDAELPGAFVVAINHHVRTMCPAADFDWVASSYYPQSAADSGDPTILDDQYGLYSSNRGHWLMGPPPSAMSLALPAEPWVTGDLMDPSVVAALADAVHARYGRPPTGATLYTSDAGIDVSGDYNSQEEQTALLNYGQVLCGILSLAPGGCLVTKQYTFTTPFSRSLIALVAFLFDEAHVAKPLTSRPANSEVYLVGKGFKGIRQEDADALLDRLGSLRKAGSAAQEWYPLIDPESWAQVDEALLRVARQVHGRQQVAFLNEAADYYKNYQGRLRSLMRDLEKEATAAQESWLTANPMRRIREDQQLCSRENAAKAQ